MVKKKPTKKTSQGKYTKPEFYEGYYWLVLAIDPYVPNWAVYSWEDDNQIGIPIPDSVETAMKETGELDRSTQVHHPTGIFVYMEAGHRYTYNFDNLFRWHIEKGVPSLHTRGNNPIVCTEDLKRLWQECGLERIDTTKEIPLLYTHDGKPITNSEDLKRLLEESGLEGLATSSITEDLKRLFKEDNWEEIPIISYLLYPKWHFDRLEAHLAPEHKKNLETLASQAGQGKKARQKRNSVTLKIKGKDVELTRTEALLLKAYQTAGEKGITHITQGVILKVVWPDDTFFGSSLKKSAKDRLKNHWSNLKKKLGKEIIISDFKMKDINGTKNYQLDRPPAWLKGIRFSKALTPIRG